MIAITLYIQYYNIMLCHGYIVNIILIVYNCVLCNTVSHCIITAPTKHYGKTCSKIYTIPLYWTTDSNL